jgi:hypothetical protein
MLEEYFSRIAKGRYRASPGKIISTAQMQRGVQLQLSSSHAPLHPTAQGQASDTLKNTKENDNGSILLLKSR